VASEGAPATLVDSNVLLDVITADARWGDWSASALATAADEGALLINPVIYAEVSVRFTRIEELEAKLPSDTYLRAAIPWSAAFLAGKVFAEYRRRGGSRRSPLPDFFIGAHAAVAGLTLLTRDATRYGSYFPRVPLVAPP
jgi:predicted nucleic acid-binding protein